MDALVWMIPTHVENIDYFHNLSKKITLTLILVIVLGQVHFFD